MKRSLTRRSFLKLGVITSGITVIQACAGEQPQSPAATAPAPAATAPAAAGSSAPKKGGQLKIASSSDLASFEPTIQLWPNIPLLCNLYDTPIQYDSKMTPQPYLATSWEPAADGLSIKMALRKGVKFHTGRDFTAEDV
ncbi:MAG: ABC transporter substrate-binding protein, partial [Dehalococcoidales bacterium]|nr:ABC transporter substrate-binding protein [Dehalococcoidales bacterium]